MVSIHKATRLILAVALMLLAAACSGAEAAPDDAATTTSAPAPTTTATEAPTTTTTIPPTTTTRPPLPPPVEFTVVDYGYQGIPDVIRVRTNLKMINGSTEEFHIAVVIRLADDDDRPAEELTALPADKILTQGGGSSSIGDVQVVFLARPGEPFYEIAEGATQIGRPGRYVVFGIVPVGSDPIKMEQRVRIGPPQPVEGVLPHYQVGEFAEFMVVEG